MKILFYATYPTIGTGYSRIGNILSNYLSEQKHEVYYFGISNFKNSTIINRYVHPNIKVIDALYEEEKNGSEELYGVNVIIPAIQQIKPDIVFLYNDLIVISRIFNKFIESRLNINFRTIVYLDLVYEFEKIELIRHVNRNTNLFLVFSDCWKKDLIKCGISQDKIEILPHGFDNKKFFPVDKNFCRKKFNFNPDDFIVLNTNRNSYRKSIDKTIDAFLQFIKIKQCDKRLKLFINMLCTDHHNNEGFDIINLIKIGCLKYDLNYNDVILNHIYKNPSNHNSFSDEMMNHLYNAVDIGINTCLGEGFGLCNLEHAGVGRPQIISKVGALADIFTNEYATLINPVAELYLTNSIDFHGGYIKICNSSDFAGAMVRYFDNLDLFEEHSKKAREEIVKKYDWQDILENFNIFVNKVGEGLLQLREKYTILYEYLRVYKYDKKIRLGNKFDGGYVIAVIEDYDYDCYISCGISNEESFSRDFIRKYNIKNSYGFDGTIQSYPSEYQTDIIFIKKNINSFNDENNDNLVGIIEQYDNIFLKMDIEGGEYEWLMIMDEEKLNKFGQIVIEFHNVNGEERITNCLKKLANLFYLVHVHGNNYDRVCFNVPRVIELTYVNRRLIGNALHLNRDAFPVEGLDFPNNEAVRDIKLNFYPFILE